MTHVILNVCGIKYEVLVATLLTRPDTMLGSLVQKWNDGGEFAAAEPGSTREIFIDRNGQRFQYVLDWYRDGYINLPPDVPYESFINDVKFFGVPVDAVEPPKTTTKPQNQLAVVSYINGRCYIEGAVVPGTDQLHRSIWGCPIIDNSMTPFPVLQAMANDGWDLVSVQDAENPQSSDRVQQYVFKR